MWSRLWSALRRFLEPRGAAAFLILAGLVGVVVGLAAAALISSIEGLVLAVEKVGEHIAEPKWIPLVSVPLGLFLAWAIARRFAPEVAGDGVPEAIAAVAIRSGYMPTRAAPLKIIATSLVIGLGGSVGREGPIVQIGGSIGSSIARYGGLGEDRIRSLVAAGAGAAIGASFNAPIAGMLFALEVIIGQFAVRHLNAVVVASVAAAVTTRSIVGEEQILRAFPHRLQDPRELVLYVGLGLLAAAVGWVFLNVLRRGEAARSLVSTESVVWGTALALVGYKMVAASLTLGVGGFGGVFMPSLFVGAALGAAYADLIDPLWRFSDLEPGAFAIVGMAATFAAVARAPLTSILIVFEITGDYGLVLPLMLAAALATLLGDWIHPDSIYVMSLARRGIRITRRSEIDVLDTVRVGDVATPPTEVADPTMTTATVQHLMDRIRHHGLPVVDEGRLVGIVTVTDVIRAGGPSDRAVVADAMTPNPVTVTPDTPVSEALARMAALGVGRVPVVAPDEPKSLVGVFRREDAVEAYHLALGREVAHDLGRERLRARTSADAEFHDLEIPADSIADGRLLKEVPIPGGCTVVSIRRGPEVLVPDGSTELRAGDVLTVFSRRGLYAQLAERLRAGDTGEIEAATEDEARFFDLEIPDGSVAVDRTIRELAVPGGCTVVSVRRQLEVIVPDGNTVLRAGDVITVFAKPASRRQLAERLRGSGAG
jgi:CIC family chloride channel protein